MVNDDRGAGLNARLLALITEAEPRVKAAADGTAWANDLLALCRDLRDAATDAGPEGAALAKVAGIGAELGSGLLVMIQRAEKAEATVAAQAQEIDRLNERLAAAETEREGARAAGMRDAALLADGAAQALRSMYAARAAEAVESVAVEIREAAAQLALEDDPR